MDILNLMTRFMHRALQSLLIFLSLFLLPLSASCQTDTIGVAVGVVEAFYNRTNGSVRKLGSVPDKEAGIFSEKASESKKKAIEELKSLRWSDTPGERRFKKVYKVVESFTAGRLDAFRNISKLSTPGDMSDITANELAALRDAELKRLKEAFKKEAPVVKKPKLVPLIDRPQYENRHDEERGMWDR
ncbi:MAG: hypothetical protein NUW09_03935 [Deltaproteobacteria bacterium]|nr:hypothetical protein [Deltaproteobacteria bacterium]